MATITYFVAMPVFRGDYGDLYAGEPVECRSRDEAIRTAHRLAAKALGAIAFSRTGDPALGDFEPAVILAKIGGLSSEAVDLMEAA